MSPRLIRLAVVVGLVAFGACAPGDQAAPPAEMSDEPAAADQPAPITQQEVDEYSDRVNAMIRNGDTAALNNVYADDAVMVSARGKVEGGGALVGFWAERVRAGAGKSLQAETLKFGSSGDLAWALSRFTGGVTAAAGHTLRVFQRQPDGSIRTVVQVSVPDMPAPQ